MPHKDDQFWAATGITFSIGTSTDLYEARQFLIENFYPDEPIFRYSLHGLLQHDCAVMRCDFNRKIPLEAAQHDCAVKLK